MKLTSNVVDRRALLSIREAAWALGVPTSAVHRAIRVGTLRAFWRRSRLVIAETDVRRLGGGAS
jgi:hypothetical protein